MMQANDGDGLCAVLKALVAQQDDASAAVLEQQIAAHIASCRVCTAAEAQLARVIGEYRRVEPQLAPEVEERLLAQLCSRR